MMDHQHNLKATPPAESEAELAIDDLARIVLDELPEKEEDLTVAAVAEVSAQ